MTIRPLYDKILIKRKAAQETSSGGLIIPAAAQEKNNTAIVMAVGNGRQLEDGTLVPLKVEVGMTVLIGKWQGQEVKVNGVDMLFLAESEVLAVVSE